MQDSCPVYRRCGGCSFRHISYREELVHTAQFVEDNLQMCIRDSNTLEGLMRNTGEGAAPAMAQQMPEEKVNEDGTVTLTYTLREATWSDGQPVTAGDFAFAWQRCADPANQMRNA